MKRIMFQHFSLAGGMLVGCGVVMLVALGLIFANGSSNWGFLMVVALCPLMHIFLHRHLHSGSDHLEAGPAKTSWETGRHNEDGNSRIAVQE